MAGYKVSIRVYQGPTGKTMYLPTLVRALGSGAMLIGIPSALVGAFNIRQDLGTFGLKVDIAFLIFGVLATALGIYLRKWSNRKAQLNYLKALGEMDQQTSGQKTD